MKTAVITFKIDAEVKEKVKATAANLGLSLSSLMSGLLMDVVKTGKVSFGYADRSEEIPNQYLIDAIKEAEEERKKGNFYSFSDSKDALKFLNSVREGKIKV